MDSQDKAREALLNSIEAAANGTKVASNLAQLAYAYSCVVAPSAPHAGPSAKLVEK